MYISLNSSKAILVKQNMKQMKETFMLLALLTMCLSDLTMCLFIVLIRQLSYQAVPRVLNTQHVPGDNFKLTDLHIKNLSFQK